MLKILFCRLNWNLYEFKMAARFWVILYIYMQSLCLASTKDIIVFVKSNFLKYKTSLCD